MTDQSEAIAHMLLKQQIEESLYHEAELLDERRYEDWLALLADDVRYMFLQVGVERGELRKDRNLSPQGYPWRRHAARSETVSS